MAKKQLQAVSPFNSRTGSQAARIDCALTITPQTSQAIAAALGLSPSRVYCHLKALGNRGLATQTKEGWKLASKAATKPQRQPLPKAQPPIKASKAPKATEQLQPEAVAPTKPAKPA